jgi:hypothetical protein
MRVAEGRIVLLMALCAHRTKSTVNRGLGNSSGNQWQGGVLGPIWVPPERTPPPLQWEFSLVPADQHFVSKRLQECNWLQTMEGRIVSSHVSWLHRANGV